MTKWQRSNRMNNARHCTIKYVFDNKESLQNKTKRWKEFLRRRISKWNGKLCLHTQNIRDNNNNGCNNNNDGRMSEWLIEGKWGKNEMKVTECRAFCLCARFMNNRIEFRQVLWLKVAFNHIWEKRNRQMPRNMNTERLWNQIATGMRACRSIMNSVFKTSFIDCEWFGSLNSIVDTSQCVCFQVFLRTQLFDEMENIDFFALYFILTSISNIFISHSRRIRHFVGCCRHNIDHNSLHIHNALNKPSHVYKLVSLAPKYDWVTQQIFLGAFIWTHWKLP